MIVSIGYEGREIGEFVRDLRARGVEILADIRLNPASRQPGFSKKALTEALGAADIGYVHLRGLGNPSDNRAAFQGTRVRQGRAIYREKLDTPAGRADLAALKELDREGVVAVLCVERDEARCHRRVVIDALG